MMLFFLLLILLFLYLFVNPNRTFLGKNIWYQPKKLVSWELDGLTTSQQVFDIYSFSHITHGIILYLVLKPFVNTNVIFPTAVALELFWEIFENTPWIINKYRSNKAYENYKGDSIANIIGDILCCLLGVYFASVTPMGAVAFALISEIILYRWRANLLTLSISSLI